jgi:hypothetical protein
MGRLRGLVERARNHGTVEVWIPETVVWEWAEHMFSETKDAAEALTRLRRAGRDIPAVAAPSVEAMEQELRDAFTAIGPPMRVLSIATVAREAVRDQLLLLGTARVKSAVKTGAADSAHLRAFEAEACGDVTTYVVVSNDTDIKNAYRNWGRPGPRIFPALNDATKAVFTAVPPSDSAVALAFMQHATPLAHEDRLDLGELGGPITRLLADHPVKGEYANVTFQAEEGLQLVGLSGVEVDSDGQYATGTLHLLGMVKGTGLIQDDSGDRVVQVWREAPGAHLRITATLELEAGLPKSLVVDTGEGEAFPARDWENLHTDPDDALAEVLGALTCLPGLADFEWYPLFDDPSETVAESALGVIHLDLLTGGNAMTGEDYEWKLTATLNEDSVSIWCRSLNDGATDADMAAAFPDHYDLGTDADGMARLNPPWAINALAVGVNDYDPTVSPHLH